jgi:peptidoglycan/LPS O-acetylase OafA/YrhL
LSGFVIALNYQNKISNFAGLLNFQLRRFFRLYPLHLVTLLIFLLYELSRYIAEEKYGVVLKQNAFSTNNAESFIENIFLVQSLFNEKLTWNRPSWSISAEFYTYLVFAFVTLLTLQKKLLLNLISVLIVSISFYLLLNSSMDPSNGFIRCLFSFFLGVITFNLSTSIKATLPNFISYLMLPFSVYMVCITDGYKEIGLNIFMPFIFAILILSLIKSSGKNYFKSALNHRYLIYLGTISYGIYMIHQLVWKLFSFLLRNFFGFKFVANAEGVNVVNIENQYFSSFVTLLGIAIIIILAHISFKYIEMPANNFRHKLGTFKS